MGNSLTYFGVDPIYFQSKTFNAADVSRPLVYDFKLFEKYQDKLSSLKTIVLPIAFNSFSGDPKSDLKNSPFGTFNYIIYYGFNEPLTLTNHSEILSMPLANVRKKVKLYLDKKSKGDSNYGWSELGWGNYYSSKHKMDLKKEDKNNKFEKRGIKEDRIDLNSKALSEFLDQLSGKGVRVVLVTPPGYNFSSNSAYYKIKDKTIEIINTLTEQYDYCDYYNMSDDKTFNIKDFYDRRHLNELGAKKFSLLLDSIVEMKKPTSQNQH
ncbi:MAG: hypothetical protein KKH44_07240 [Bacteroidetes bacterium]|nr:hypothetical protein [Bacteroidota bacterium]